jgi:uncharacterized protein YdaU (DUF1376 family)
MPLYIADFLRKTTHLGALESGAYILLIMDYWQNDGLPSDDRQLARIAKMTDREWKASKATLQAFFHDGWKHDRIDDEIKEAIKLAQSNAGKARDAANKRWSKHNQDKREAMHEACSEHAPRNATNDAPECTLHTSQSKEDTADAVSSKYFFESGIIRLVKKDFDRWQASFSKLDLAAELTGLTKWAAELGPDRWFHGIAGALNKRNREVKAAADREAPAPFKWNGIEGVI